MVQLFLSNWKEKIDEFVLPRDTPHINDWGWKQFLEKIGIKHEEVHQKDVQGVDARVQRYGWYGWQGEDFGLLWDNRDYYNAYPGQSFSRYPCLPQHKNSGKIYHYTLQNSSQFSHRYQVDLKIRHMLDTKDRSCDNLKDRSCDNLKVPILSI